MRKPRTKAERKIVELEKEIENLTAAASDLTQKATVLASDRNDLRASIEELQIKLAEAEEQNTALHTRNKRLSESTQQEIKDLHNRVGLFDEMAERANTQSRVYERTAIIFAMLFLGSDEEYSISTKLSHFDAARDLAGFSTEALGSTPSKVMIRAFEIITPTFLELISSLQSKPKEKKAPKEIVITPEDLNAMIKAQLDEYSSKSK